LWNAVNVSMTALLRQDGRRVVLVFTDGWDAPERRSSVSLPEVMRRAQREDVMVYAIGLASGGFGGGRGRGGRRGLRGGGGGRGSGEPSKPDEGLRKIAVETGGGYFELTAVTDLGSTFARVADELHRQYAMGFTPSAFDGKTHKLDVRATRPGLTVRARKSYVATKE
jgi:VWFA-related protein